MRRREFITLLGGAAATWPVAGHAQQPKTYTVGVLWHAGSAEEEGAYFTALVGAFSKLGQVNGRNIKLEHRFPNEAPERFRKFAEELVSSKVDILVTVGAATAPYAKNATTIIPIVFVLVSDPVGSHLVNSLAAPGGNVTGLSSFSTELTQKRLQLLKDTIPGLSRVGLLVNPNERSAQSYVDEAAKAAAQQLDFTIEEFDVRSVEELDSAFDSMVKRGVQAVILAPGGLLYQGRATVAKLGLTNRLAICAWSKETFEPGALMAYGPDYLAMVGRAPVYVEKILKGAKPAELPVEQPTKFQLSISLRTAKAIGREFPPTLIARADQVVE